MALFKMALLGYLYGLASERRLAQEVELNLAYRWFLGYDLDEATPNHSVLSKARRRFGKKVYEEFFRQVVLQCETAGLIEGTTVYLDSTLVRRRPTSIALARAPCCSNSPVAPQSSWSSYGKAIPMKPRQIPGPLGRRPASTPSTNGSAAAPIQRRAWCPVAVATHPISHTRTTSAWMGVGLES